VYQHLLRHIGDEQSVVAHAVAFAEAVAVDDWDTAAKHFRRAEVVYELVFNVVAVEQAVLIPR
jgi:hypothetical protein